MKFIKGMFLGKPRDGAPSFVKGSMSIKMDDFLLNYGNWVNDRGYINIDLLENQSGEFYLSPNDYGTKAAGMAEAPKPTGNPMDKVREAMNPDVIDVVEAFGAMPDDIQGVISKEQDEINIEDIPF